jgi:hypothetical protein
MVSYIGNLCVVDRTHVLHAGIDSINFTLPRVLVYYCGDEAAPDRLHARLVLHIDRTMYAARGVW